MNEPSTPGYRSFLIRLWPTLDGEDIGWRGELEYIQNGRLLAFDSLQELTDFLHWQAQPLDVEF
ncbi:MAG: hypothetical protein KC547_23715, partial [Anaerolineae bacterium]|nr:hypothetical protein [Anaerolineae bacterium]